MTQHVRTSYRRHRRATWGLAIALAVAVAAVVIPIASGAPDKTYTILFPSTAAVSNPSAPVAGSTTAQTLCRNTSYGAVKFVISNTAKSASLGSVDVTYPTDALGLTLGTPTFSGSVASGATITKSGGVVSLRGLNLPSKTGSVTFQVPVTTSATVAGPSGISAVAKQSNDFNDNTGDANTFSIPAFPSLKTQNCDQTITGRVYHDRDQSGAFSPNNPNSPATNDIAKAGWTVTLQRNVGGTYTTVGSDTTDATGMYEVTGQLGGSYRLCVTAPGSPDPDNGVAWAVRTLSDPAYWTLASGCAKITASSPGTGGVGISSLTTTNATGEDFALVPVTVFDFQGGQTTGTGTNYVVTAGGDSTKLAAHYTKETFTDANGRPYFIFAPINACTGCGQIYLLEHLQGSVAQSALGADKQIKLVYDDVEPFTNFQPMPYCLQDPRGASDTDLLTANVLPPNETSCIVEGHQTVRGNGTPAGAFVDFEVFVYSSYDGGRGMG